ncbi:YbgC/FadM family acyl-CoA thioesterase [Sphingomonas psychrotolerans]|uniref:YbgC/FadM family acyl-CoA thioesterase n=1 Tax=Sphingomonas psychrotolerans TaxID=1327635 RepID=A0ABU3N5T5_9SPHN|nr:YbgC/FadM family acyl-CoA thioesterase [Sphingomonas psychrotolerans]MDT8759897.1 YbgC/FadM family acyl-CoA thioesterase [Sphingomonas psychrotolerans]
MHALSALGRFEGLEHHFGLRVYFEDTDLTGVVYHANYLRYLERARSDMLLAAGVDQRTTFESGEGAYALRSVRLDYRTPARLGEELIVVSRLVSLRAAAVVIQQRVIRGETIVAQGEVEAAFVSPAGRPRRQPAEWMAAFEPLLWKGN